MTAVIPYFGYARQDRRIERRSLGGRVAASVVETGHFDRLMLIDAHTASIEGFFDVPIDHLTAVPMLADAVRHARQDLGVVVAPDLGAVKIAREYARRLHLPMAVVHKTRLSGDTVEAHEVMGQVQGRMPLLVDDMLSTGGTMTAAAGALRSAGAAVPMTVAVSHLLLAGTARDRLGALPLAAILAANTVAIERPAGLALDIVSVAPLIATAVRRNHFDESLVDLRVRT
jgi:ribose-phosphate pyrophosphokinase